MHQLKKGGKEKELADDSKLSMRILNVSDINWMTPLPSHRVSECSTMEFVLDVQLQSARDSV